MSGGKTSFSVFSARIWDCMAPRMDCGIGACGACTVLVDGKTRRACVTPLRLVDGTECSDSGGTRVQRTGLYTRFSRPLSMPELFSAVSALPVCSLRRWPCLVVNPKPTRDDIRKAFRGNICRCTGYQQIFQAVEDAAETMSGQNGSASNIAL